MKPAAACAIGFLTLSCACLLAATPRRQQAPEIKSQPSGRQVAQDANSQGEKLFRTHCGRCHNPPEDISPREARAVVRQMRVRAMLNAEDEKQILQYLAP
jgi:cytochrome c5